jgi:hypothetical protein
MFRKKPEEIEFVTPAAQIAEMFPPVPAGRMTPQWVRAMAPYTKKRRFPNLRTREEVTMKGCPGVGDYLNLGWIIPLWTDYIFTANPDGFGWDSAVPDELDNVKTFEPELQPTFPRGPNDHAHILKIGTPWMVRTPPGWSVLICAPWYQRETRFTIMPGVMESDRFHVVTVVAVWHLPLGESTLIKAGTPLLHIIPVKRNSMTMKLSTEGDEYNAMYGRGLDAPYGVRLAPGGYRENGRKDKATTTQLKELTNG